MKRFDELEDMWFDFYGVDCNRFKLDDTIYEAIEDESDGYRSMLDTIIINDRADSIFFKTPICRVKVQSKNTHSFEGYVLVDENNHEWLQAGTDHCDDYYPVFIFEYNPKQGE